jgi:DNA polymerase III sliding clamp (beta) subunit (PCNA family)
VRTRRVSHSLAPIAIAELADMVMKLTANAGALARAVGAAAALCDSRTRSLAAFEAVQITADGDSVIKIAGHVGDFALRTRVPVETITGSGALAVSGSRLAGVARGFPASAEILISTEGNLALVSCQRSRFKLPICGVPFVAQRSTMRFHSDYCR